MSVDQASQYSVSWYSIASVYIFNTVLKTGTLGIGTKYWKFACSHNSADKVFICLICGQ